MPIRSAHDGFACSKCISQRARGDLRRVQIRSEVNICRTNKLLQLFIINKMIVENNLLLHAQFAGKLLQLIAVLLTMRCHQIRMRRTQDDVHHLRMLSQDCGHRADYMFQTFIWRQKAESEQHRLAFNTKFIFVKI